MLKQGDTAPDTNILLSDGTETNLSTLWQQGNVMLVFLRHFG